MLKKSKVISLVLAFVFCLTFLAPAFVTPNAAQASTTYEVLSAPTVKTSSVAQDLGVIKVKLPDTALFAYSRVTVSLPSDLTFAAGTVPVSGTAPAPGAGITIVAPGGADGLVAGDFTGAPYTITGNNCFDIQINNPMVTSGVDKYFYIYFNGVDLNNTTGDITVGFSAPSGSGFSSASDVVIGKSTSGGSTTTTVKKVVDITDAGATIDTISVSEGSSGSFNAAKGPFVLEILTKGFSWSSSSLTAAAGVGYGWSISPALNETMATAAAAAPVRASITGNNNEKLNYTMPAGVVLPTTAAGRVSFDGLSLNVDDSKVKAGDEVEIKISGYGMDKATMIVAKFVDYNVSVEEGTVKTVKAGHNAQELGEFYIKEGAFGSLVNNRVIEFTLPSGVQWNNNGDYSITNASNITLNGNPGYPAISGDNNQTLKWQISGASTNEGAEIKCKAFKVNISPDFEGDLVVEVSGSAGAEGSVKLAEVKPSATLSVESAVNVQLGKANQKIGDITITEGATEGLIDTNGANNINLDLDNGYRFSKIPKVEVVEGDIDLDIKGVDLATNSSNVADGRLVIEVTGQSVKTPAKILISDVYVDAFRTAPEGAVTINFASGINAINEVVAFNNKTAGEAVIANCITAAAGEIVGNGEFVIGSNIYSINGIKKVMDVAPYIKNERTYVPVRYLAYVLGVSEDDVVWDEAAQKVTLTKGDNVVEMVIGSTTITVNGEAQTMDVAPEISSDRTMLPARYVAEGLGALVGWDPATQTVIITK